MKKIVDFTLSITLVFAVLYLVVITIIDQANMSLGNAPAWASRVALIAGTIVAIVRYRIKNDNLITFTEGMKVGMFTAFIIGTVITLHTFIYREYIRPTYNQEMKDLVHKNLALQVNEEGGKLWTEEQIQRQLTQQWGMYFTTKGGVIIDILGAIGLGLLTSCSIAYMARRVRVKD